MPRSTPLPSKPTVRQARDSIGGYGNLALRGETTKVFARGRHVATIAPLSSRGDVSGLPTISVSDLKSGRRTFFSLLIEGPCVALTRNKRPVALISLSEAAARRTAGAVEAQTAAVNREILARLESIEAKLDALQRKS
jgi:antitoxin (DNA-binding transcriptional repressor) of toxin-antitoxin stability system